MEVVVLGSGCGVPSLKRGAPGLLVKSNKELFLFDSGAGTLNRLLKCGIDYRKIDHVFYSHFHPDHIIGFVPLLFACKYHSEPRKKTLNIYGPPGIKRYYSDLLNIYGRWIKPETFQLRINELKKKVLKRKTWQIEREPVQHSADSLGYRLTDKQGRVIVYSGDTDYCKGLIKIAKNADLLILECSFPGKKRIVGHLTPRSAGKAAKESKCKKLLLTHFYPICDKYDIRKECRKEYRGKLVLARDGMRIRV